VRVAQSRPRSKCPRPARTILGLLLAGAVINVLVAWASARWGDSPTGTVRSVESVPPEADAFINDAEYLGSFGFDLRPTPNGMRLFFNPEKSKVGQYTTGLDYSEVRSVACTRTAFARWFTDRSTFAREYRRMQFGLPMRSLEFAERFVRDIRSIHGSDAGLRWAGWRGGWPIAPSEQDQRSRGYRVPAHVYPLSPIPLGFAANTFLYALLLFAFFLAPRHLRRRSRRRRGLCLKCAYPVGTSAVCTECGTAISP
jgi:hypothetical protein